MDQRHTELFRKLDSLQARLSRYEKNAKTDRAGLGMHYDHDHDFADYEVQLSRDANELADSIISMIHTWTSGKSKDEYLDLPNDAQYADVECAIRWNIVAGRIENKGELVNALHPKMKRFVSEYKYYKNIIEVIWEAVNQFS